MNLVKDNPAFAFKFGFIQNTSQPAAAINESAPAHTTANEPTPVRTAANEPTPVRTTANEPTPTHSKDDIKNVAANNVKEGVAGGGGGGKRESVHVDQEDTRPIYEQLDILGNQEEKQTGGTCMNKVMLF